MAATPPSRNSPPRPRPVGPSIRRCVSAPPLESTPQPVAPGHALRKTAPLAISTATHGPVAPGAVPLSAAVAAYAPPARVCNSPAPFTGRSPLAPRVLRADLDSAPQLRTPMAGTRHRSHSDPSASPRGPHWRHPQLRARPPSRPSRLRPRGGARLRARPQGRPLRLRPQQGARLVNLALSRRPIPAW